MASIWNRIGRKLFVAIAIGVVLSLVAGAYSLGWTLACSYCAKEQAVANAVFGWLRLGESIQTARQARTGQNAKVVQALDGDIVVQMGILLTTFPYRDQIEQIIPGDARPVISNLTAYINDFQPATFSNRYGQPLIERFSQYRSSGPPIKE